MTSESQQAQGQPPLKIFEYKGQEEEEDQQAIIPNDVQHLVINTTTCGQSIASDTFENCRHSLITIEFTSAYEPTASSGDDNDDIAMHQQLQYIHVNAFQRCDQLKSIINIPTSLEAIGNDAFTGCENLERITFSEIHKSNLKLIGSGAFRGCVHLTDIHLPSTMVMIDKEAFQRCHRLQTVEFLEGCPTFATIGDKAFERCKTLTKIEFPKSIQTIGNESFSGCESLNFIGFEINDSIADSTQLLQIGNKAFLGCEKLKAIEFPLSIESIGKRAFSLCDSLTRVEFHSNSSMIESIEEGVFYECEKLAYVNLPTSVNRIGKRAFYNCFPLISIQLPADSQLAHVEDQACKGCQQLFNFHIPGNQNDDNDITELQKLVYHHDDVNLLENLQRMYKEQPDQFQIIVDEELNMTPLHIYAASTTSATLDIDVLKFLIETNPGAVIHDDKWGRRPIHYACMTGSINNNIDAMWELSALSRSSLLSPGAVSFVLGEDNDKDTPLTLGIRYGYLPLDLSVKLYSLNPISLTEHVNGEDEKKKLVDIVLGYIHAVTKDHESNIFSIGKDGATGQSFLFMTTDRQHGWVQFLQQQSFFQEGKVGNRKKVKKKKGQPLLPDIEASLGDFFRDPTECNDMVLKLLSYAKDSQGQVAIDVALSPKIKQAMQLRLDQMEQHATDNNINADAAMQMSAILETEEEHLQNLNQPKLMHESDYDSLDEDDIFDQPTLESKPAGILAAAKRAKANMDKEFEEEKKEPHCYLQSLNQPKDLNSSDNNSLGEEDLFDKPTFGESKPLGLLAAAKRAKANMDAVQDEEALHRSQHLPKTRHESDNDSLDEDELFDRHTIRDSWKPVGLLAAAKKAKANMNAAQEKGSSLQQSQHLRNLNQPKAIHESDDDSLGEDELFDRPALGESKPVGLLAAAIRAKSKMDAIHDEEQKEGSEQQQPAVASNAVTATPPRATEPKANRSVAGVNWYTDESTGQDFFYLKPFTFPNRKIIKLMIQFGPNQENEVSNQQKQLQIEGNYGRDSSIFLMLPNCPIQFQLECGDRNTRGLLPSSLSSNQNDSVSSMNNMMSMNQCMTDLSFQLPGYKMRAIRMRMYTIQREDAEQQIASDDFKGIINLNCDVECRLVHVRGASDTTREGGNLQSRSNRKADGQT